MKNRKGVLYLILLFALALRLYGINFEVPHPDDYITVQGAMHFGPAQITPTGYGLYGLYVWPAFTMVYAQIILFSIYFAIGWMIGIFPDLESFRNLYLSDPSSFHLIGRIMSVFFAAGTVWILYYLGRKLYNHKTGLMAALFLSASFIHSFHSQFIRPDVPATFFSVLTIMYCLSILDSGAYKYYIAAGIMTGLAVATKFTSGILILPIIAAHIMIERKREKGGDDKSTAQNIIPVTLIVLGAIMLALNISISSLKIIDLNTIRFSPHEKLNQDIIAFLLKMTKAMTVSGGIFIITGILFRYSKTVKNIITDLLGSKRLFFAMAAAFLSFVVFDPIFFADIKNQIRIFITDANYGGKNTYFVGVDSLGFWGNLWWYIKGPINWGAGLHIEIMAGLGLLLVLMRKRREDILVLIFPLVYILVIGLGKFKWERYAVTLMPFVALYAAYFLYTLTESIFAGRITENKKAVVLSLLSIVLILPQTYNILRYDYLLTQKDTRVMVREWVEENVIQGSKIGQDAYTGDLPDESYEITKKFSLSDKPLNYYIENGFEYLLVSDTQYRRFLAEPSKYPENVKFYKSLFSEGKLIKEFKPRDDLWPRPDERFSKYHIHVSPTIKVYKIN